MIEKKSKFIATLIWVLMAAVVLSGCSLVPLLVGRIPVADAAGDVNIPISGPETARDAALDFIRFNFPGAAPDGALLWSGVENLTNDVVGASKFQYISGSWVGGVSFPVTSPQETVYSVKFENRDSDFSWEGVVDSAGRVITTLVSFQEPEATPIVVNPTPTNTPIIGKADYYDDVFHIRMKYPSEWSLQEHIAGDNAKALALRKGTLLLTIYYKYHWDDTGFGGGLPLGDVVGRGIVTLLGREIPRHFVVHDGKEKVMFYGDNFEDLDFYIYLEADLGASGTYYDVDLPESLFDEVDAITTSIVRTGPPASSPTPTSTPTSTPTLVPTTTPVSHCDWVEFVKDVTIPDGTEIAAGKTFVKTWRLRNRGTCSWTTGYSLVFTSGSAMGEVIDVPIPELVAPGNAINLSITMTAPDSTGNYRGYWMLMNTSGYRFGSGEGANKAFFVDIKSVGSSEGVISGKICYPSERIPAMTLYLQNTDKGWLTEVPIKQDQGSYKVQVAPGNYIAYAWTLNYELAGSYSSDDHPMENFTVKAGKTTTGIDICDWYHEPGTIPFPDPSKYGTITGSLSFPSENIPPLRIVAYDPYNETYFWVDTVENQKTYEINNLMPGYYTVVAYVKSRRFAGGYTEFAKCGLEPGCPDDHTLVMLYIAPGETISNVDPGDWYVPVGTFPPDPTR